MAENNSGVKGPEDILEEIKSNPDWILSKVLFERFGILHEFHIYQLKCYMVACCAISIGGAVKVDPDTKTVFFELYTDKNYRVEAGKPIPRSKLSFRKLFGIGKAKYNSEVKIARSNLRKWTQRLLWQNTSVQITIDGVNYG